MIKKRLSFAQALFSDQQHWRFEQYLVISFPGSIRQCVSCLNSSWEDLLLRMLFLEIPIMSKANFIF